MSQLTKTVLGGCGLMVGWNMAPPPPGPMILKSPGREPPASARMSTARATRRRKKIIYFFSLLSIPLFRFLFGRKFVLCQTPLGLLNLGPQELSCVFIVDFLEYSVG